MTNPTPIGFLGLGHMRASMAEPLLAPDIKLFVFETRQEAMEEVQFLRHQRQAGSPSLEPREVGRECAGPV